MKTIKDKTFDTGVLSKLTDEPTRFENCHFKSHGVTADVLGCEIVNCIFGTESWKSAGYEPHAGAIGYAIIESDKITPIGRPDDMYPSLNVALAAGEKEIEIR